MVNDITTLNGSLMELGETLATNITAKGVSASASDGLTTLANKVLQISGDTPTPPTPTVLFEDACDSATGLTNYGTLKDVQRTGATGTLSYDSTENAYKLEPTSYHTGEIAVMPITPLNGEDNYTITCKVKHGGNVAQCQPMLVFYDSSLSYPNLITYCLRYMGNGTISLIKFTSSGYSEISQTSGQTIGVTTSYFTYELTKEGNTISITVYNDSNTKLFEYNNYTVSDTTLNAVGIGAYYWDNTRWYYIKDIKAESIGGGSDCSQYTQQIEDAIAFINGDGN